ncbi:hypothetical protein N9L19_00180 [bacterium]|nr:hypothetical protein [bacterium]MDA8609309.1 hypothetical protein [bacterium]
MGQIKSLLAKEDYAGAAASHNQSRLDAATEESHRRKRGTEALIKYLLANEDYAGAAALHTQIR